MTTFAKSHLVSTPRDISTFSFYVSASEAQLLPVVAEEADAIVIAGAAGPSKVVTLRRNGFTSPVLFDKADYSRPDAVPSDSHSWFDEQEKAGAAVLLSPGTWVPWTNDLNELEKQFDKESQIAFGRQGAIPILAIDARWLTRGASKLFEMFGNGPVPVALVLGHKSDPLTAAGSVDALRHISAGNGELFLLRSDHGAIGALAYGARHGSIGVLSKHRHLVPPGSTGGGIPNDRTPRLFIPELLDWFTAGNVAGWATTSIPIRCYQPCCSGQELARFLDPIFAVQAKAHNVYALAELVRSVLEVPVEDSERRKYFGRLCINALQNYGQMGKITARIEAKAQLTQWAQFAA